MAKAGPIVCSFCGRDKKDAKILIAGITGHICDVCISQAFKIVSEENGAQHNQQVQHALNILKPQAIKKHLDEYIIGQDEAKKILSVAVYNHFKRVAHAANTKEEIEIDKSNVILVGETGTGKTLMARTIAKLLNVPFCIIGFEAVNLTRLLPILKVEPVFIITELN